MRAIWIKKHGGPQVLEVRETPDPEPKRGEVRVRVRACGLNFAEVMARQGLYPDAPKPPCVVGYEGAGVIDALGEGVTEPTLGARVLFLSRFGGHADTVVVPAEQVTAMPDAMTFEQGAALPVNYITAYHMLFRVARLQGGEHVLVHMAAGGVGTAVLQLCRTLPGVVTYGTASRSKHAFLVEQGCQHPIDYRSLDYAAEIKRLTGGRGVDVVLDALGGADWKKGYGLLAPAGILIAFGLANVNKGGTRRLLQVVKSLAQVPRFSPMSLMDDNRAVAGVNIGHLWREAALLRSETEALMTLFEAGKIAPHVSARYPFSRAADAHAELEYGRNVGKVVLIPD
ncbi:MAG TPA: medium chain dehydrogenase/reductase family protein [Polyangiaceae bacterium]